MAPRFPAAVAVLLQLLALAHLFQSDTAVSYGWPIEDMGQFPYLCRFTGPTRCSCSIISERYIMTAAHCLRTGQIAGLRAAFDSTVTKPSGVWYNLTDILPNLNVTIRVSTHDFRLNNSIDVPATRVAVPPNYTATLMPFFKDDPQRWIKDMAILELATPLNFSRTVQPAKFLTEKAYKQIPAVDKEKCIIAGWGGLNDSLGDSIVNPLKSLLAHYGYWKMACNEVCAVAAVQYYHNLHNIRNFYNTSYTSEMLTEVYTNMTIGLEQGLVCGSPNPSGMEGGNSGGPALVKNSKTGQTFQIGITQSNYITTSYRTDPFQFMRVSSERKWLEKITKGQAKFYDDYNAKC